MFDVRNLVIQHQSTEAPPAAIVTGIDLHIARGECLALVGESGCGKSLTALALLGLLPPNLHARFDAYNLADAEVAVSSERDWRSLRGRRVGMIFQEPASALNPVMMVGEQIDEALAAQHRRSRRHRRDAIHGLLDAVGIPDAPRRARAYPHELSGGMRQRVMIAIALAGDPEVLIADEPTTALDVTIQAQVLALLRRIQSERGLALLFISHDLGVVARIADQIAVMYCGRIVERGPAAQILAAPAHPYTRALLTSANAAAATPTRDARLPVIAGDVPSAARRPPGCAFHPRCPHSAAESRCASEVPPWWGQDHGLACWLHDGD